MTPSEPRLFLIGYRGTGKSTVARLLADRFEWEAIDADAILEERVGKSIREVFADEGESGFRRREEDVLTELCRRSNCVVATGGGVVLRAVNRGRLREAGPVVWLTADAETIWRRMSSDEWTAQRRPALTVGGLAEVVELLAAREPLYRECATVRVETAGRTPNEVADEVIKALARGGR